MMTHRQAEDLSYALGIPLYFLDGKITQREVAGAERVTPTPVQEGGVAGPTRDGSHGIGENRPGRVTFHTTKGA